MVRFFQLLSFALLTLEMLFRGSGFRFKGSMAEGGKTV